MSKIDSATKMKLDRVRRNFISRCTSENHPQYYNYGGRGIFVDNEWLNNREAFFEWALNNGYRTYLFIDREDNDGGYEPNNCRWVDRDTNNNNRRNTIKVIFRGEERKVSDLVKESGLSRMTIMKRIERYGVTDDLLKIKRVDKCQNRVNEIVATIKPFILSSQGNSIVKINLDIRKMFSDIKTASGDYLLLRRAVNVAFKELNIKYDLYPDQGKG